MEALLIDIEDRATNEWIGSACIYGLESLTFDRPLVAKHPVYDKVGRPMADLTVSLLLSPPMTGKSVSFS